MNVFNSYQHILTRPHWLATGAAAVLFAAVLAWSDTVVHAPAPAAIAQPAAPAPLNVSAGTTLFGAQADSGRHDTVQLLGILSFDKGHAAAVVSVGGEPARVVAVKGRLGEDATLNEIRAHSIVVERNGIEREIPLTAAQNPEAFVR